jgi:hypothetical protein
MEDRVLRMQNCPISVFGPTTDPGITIVPIPIFANGETAADACMRGGKDKAG